MSNACGQIKDMKVLTRTQEMEKSEERKLIPPKDDFVKMNFDGALFTRNQKASMDIVIRNSKGKCIIIRHKQRSIYSPVQAESEAALFGLQMAISMGVKKIVVEGNSKITINALKEPLEERQAKIRNYIND